MSCSAGGRDDDRAPETMPLELLPLHRGLEEDGSSWRAALPRPENLLRRVTARVPRVLHLTETSAPTTASSVAMTASTTVATTVATAAPAPRQHRRRKPENRRAH
jgi:hypothetical protein